MVILALIALLCLNIGTPGEAQDLDSTDSETTSKLPVYLRELEKIEEDGMENQDQGAPQSRSLSDNDHMKRDGSLESSTALQKRVKSNQRDLRSASSGCNLSTCEIDNLADTLHHMAEMKDADSTPRRNTSDPYGYGKKRRRRSIFLPGY